MLSALTVITIPALTTTCRVQACAIETYLLVEQLCLATVQATDLVIIAQHQVTLRLLYKIVVVISMAVISIVIKTNL